MSKTKGGIKTERVLKALNHEEPDRVPITDFFWSLFLQEWQKEKGKDAFIYDYYDLDILVVSPNMDPRVMRSRFIEKNDEYMIYETGWGSVIKRQIEAPMPMFLEFGIKSAADYAKFEFDDPLDPRRYYDERDDIINTGDTYLVLPSFAETVERYKNDYFIFGSVCEPFEALWRCRGTEGALMDLVLYPDETQAFIDRLTEHMLAIGKKQIEMFNLKGMYIWGDVAYDKGMFFSPDLWRKMFYPAVKKLCTEFHAMGAKIIYHGCGNARAIYEDLIDAGVDCYNPLEAKAGLDVVELKRQYKGRLAFNGNIDVRVLAEGDKDAIRREVLRKLNAAKGGGYIISSDHSVAANVPPENYDYLVQLVREYGRYPLDLGEFDEEI
ncbi:Uroporphyrinogen decarboxylase [Neomoorella glycerini]|uniref:Uroporphyrinogen decarboxylase n=1 Tax=Neomoorella glycerini TaxID=55779 RepID=A0A6I5ZU14_9FIRM|nr:uroporphyrinogen decarboxylase family protein [Moorella glycerini]QGP93246.1 Uroporphyrinogen decarboxylase [Moorella glycerini]